VTENFQVVDLKIYRADSIAFWQEHVSDDCASMLHEVVLVQLDADELYNPNLTLTLKSPSTLADMEMGCIPFTATVLSHHARLYNTLVHTPLQDCVSAKLARLQREVPCMRIGHKLMPEGYVPYAVRVENMLKAVGVHSRIASGRGDLASPLLCFPAITRLHDIPGAVAVLRRSVRYRLASRPRLGLERR